MFGIFKNTPMKYKRILLKLSGEALMGGQNYGIDPQRLAEYAAEIKRIAQCGVQIGIVIGGGNIFREPPREWTAYRATTWACLLR